MFLHFRLYLWILYSTLMHLFGIACASWLFKWIGQGFQPSNPVLIYSITESTVLPHRAYSLNTGMQPGAWHSKAKQTAASVWRKSGFDRSLSGGLPRMLRGTGLPCLPLPPACGTHRISAVFSLPSLNSWTKGRGSGRWHRDACPREFREDILFAAFALCETEQSQPGCV